jgi:hypothetical protein
MLSWPHSPSFKVLEMTQSAAMPGPTTRVSADRRRDKEIAEARPPASDPALSANKRRMCDGMSSVSAAVQIENSGAGGRSGITKNGTR